MHLSPSSILVITFLASFVTFVSVDAFESLVQAQGEVRKDFPVKPLPFASPDWNFYHRTIQLHRHIINLSNNCLNADITPKIALPGESLSTGGALSPDRHIDPDLDDPDIPLSLSSAANGLLYLIVRSSQPADNVSSASRFANKLLRRSRTAQTTRVMFVFGEEGRDLFTSEIALRILRDVCSAAATDESLHATSSRLRERLKEGVELVLVPILNPDGRRISEMGRRCDRANANDVDIDRNWPSFWQESDSLNTPPKSSRETGNDHGELLRDAVARKIISRNEPLNYVSPSSGTHPLSEPETRSLKAIVEKMRPASYVSVRTGARALTIPWDCKPSLLSESQRMRLQHVIEYLSAMHCTRCKTGNLWNVTGRVKCGTATDYMYGTLHIPFVHTWHVYNVSAPHGDCFRRHNPVSKEGYDRVTRNWANAVFNFSNAVLDWVTLENTEGVHIAEKNASLSAAQARIRRTEAFARGIRDPERDEFDISDFQGTRNSSELHQDTARETQKAAQKGRTPLFKVFKNQLGKALGNAYSNNTGLSEDSLITERTTNITESSESVLFTGWFGVLTACFLMAAGFHIARRYIFRRHFRRKLFLGRLGEKHA